MEAVRKVLFYGNSVILGSLRARLNAQPQFQVTILLPPFPGKQRLEELNPDVIFFDLEASYNEAVFPLLESCPNLMLIGISPDSNLVKVWSSRQLRELSTRDLMGVIDSQSENVPVEICQGGMDDRRNF